MYLEWGHTQSEGDCAHSVIDKATRNVSISTPDQWYTLVSVAKRQQPYMVHEMSQDSFFDLNNLQNIEKDVENQKVKWNTIKMVRTSPEYPDSISFECNYDKEEPFKTLNLMEK